MAILLWGGRSQARIIQQMILEQGLGEVALVYDPSLDAPYFDSPAEFIREQAVLEARLSECSHFVACIGNEHGYARFMVAESLKARGLQPLSVAHPQSLADPSALVGEGCQRMPFSLVHKFAKVGRQCLLNSFSCVEHECVLGDGVHVMGHAALAGKVEVGDFATIGTNATLLPGLRVGKGAIVGAGAVLTKDVPDYAVVAGNPARQLRKHEPRLEGLLPAPKGAR